MTGNIWAGVLGLLLMFGSHVLPSEQHEFILGMDFFFFFFLMLDMLYRMCCSRLMQSCCITTKGVKQLFQLCHLKPLEYLLNSNPESDTTYIQVNMSRLFDKLVRALR